MSGRLRSFALFWYDFVVGDDWRVATGVVLSLGATAAVSRTAVPAWWVLPAAVGAILGFSVWRAARASTRLRR